MEIGKKIRKATMLAPMAGDLQMIPLGTPRVVFGRSHPPGRRIQAKSQNSCTYYISDLEWACPYLPMKLWFAVNFA